ncbi:MAG: hypothetical protein FWF24_03485 [Alphaproteobacteria bacterium]|nr:hypothetical protein [Alphaproteobacteria bacterium]
MSGFETIKPSYDEWMYFTQVVLDRLSTVTQIYKNPPHVDAYMREKERQEKLGMTVAVMRQLHTLTDEPAFGLFEEDQDTSALEEGLIAQIQLAMVDVLAKLPIWSADMQLLLKSPWMQNCAGKVATILFRGPERREEEGIGSGMVEHGRLPAKLAAMVDLESAGGERAARVKKPAAAQGDVMRREDLARLWAKQNGAFLRTAGRMD